MSLLSAVRRFILDIFDIHARTKGRLRCNLRSFVRTSQTPWYVESPGRRATRGGIGSRFWPGESQLEVDRRLIRKRISTLKNELKAQPKARIQSKSGGILERLASLLLDIPMLVKSTLNQLIFGADVYAKDELFAALDQLPEHFLSMKAEKDCSCSTVGFIQRNSQLI